MKEFNERKKKLYVAMDQTEIDSGRKLLSKWFYSKTLPSDFFFNHGHWPGSF